MTEGDSLPRVNRGCTLTAIGMTAGTVVGLDAPSERAIAWARFDVCFRGCLEVWVIATESDIDHSGTDDATAVAHAIVASNGEAVESTRRVHRRKRDDHSRTVRRGSGRSL
jgi:hypothetical protein